MEKNAAERIKKRHTRAVSAIHRIPAEVFAEIFIPVNDDSYFVTARRLSFASQAPRL